MDKHVTYLIDSDDNEYTLTKASDITMHYEDSRLLSEILLLIFGCFVGNYIMHLLYLPSFFGSILAGVLLGSAGYIKSVIQVGCRVASSVQTHSGFLNRWTRLQEVLGSFLSCSA